MIYFYPLGFLILTWLIYLFKNNFVFDDFETDEAEDFIGNAEVTTYVVFWLYVIIGLVWSGIWLYRFIHYMFIHYP